MGAAYSFVSEWHLPAPPERCWLQFERLLKSDEDATWWPGLTVPAVPARIAVGEELTLAVRSPLGYRLRVLLRLTGLESGRALAATSSGDLHGRGTMRLEATDFGTSALFTWDVETTSRWMNATAFALRPAFARGHAAVMRDGERALRAVLRG